MTRVSAPAVVMALALPAFAILTFATAAQAESRYCARLGPDDHYSSSGEPLGTVGAIVQQDRANYHRFGRRDPEDEPDPVFAEKANRDVLNGRVDANALSEAERREIIEGAPYICVTVSDDGAAYITSIR